MAQSFRASVVTQGQDKTPQRLLAEKIPPSPKHTLMQPLLLARVMEGTWQAGRVSLHCLLVEQAASRREWLLLSGNLEGENLGALGSMEVWGPQKSQTIPQGATFTVGRTQAIWGR